MAGLIQKQMFQGGAPMPDMGDEEGGPDMDTDPNYQNALKFAMQALYENNAAEGVARSLRSAPSPAEGLAEVAYEITSIVDERTDGSVPDELYMAMASEILEEVADIGEAAGIKYRPSDVAVAMKQIILRFMGEQGVDTTQLEQAMNQVDPEEFDRMEEAEPQEA